MPSHFDQGFGVEIECYLPEGATTHSVARAVEHRLGKPVQAETYNHHLRDHWKVVTDGSLGDLSRGIELVSPILRGEAGLAEADRVCSALADFGCTVNKKCGLHVHVGVGHPGIKFFKNLVKLYALYEPVIDSMLPASRRASNTTFCKSITPTKLTAIDAAPDFAYLRNSVNPGLGNGARYYKLNLSAFTRHRTVEFRHHSGTLDGNKVRKWTLLCLRMVAAAMNPELALGTASTRVNGARPGSKAHVVGELMLRPEGVTGREALAATGWPSISLPQQAQICGLAFTTQRMGREVRYFAQAAAVGAPTAPITIDGLAALLGSADDERAYMHQRAADLVNGAIAWAA